ncbi:hypothetical protein ANO11243_050820 [Dothideomycetidae sp. 11243]|nr:hypothetical protein ANO11243_050820 [fungal sp. No.11243]
MFSRNDIRYIIETLPQSTTSRDDANLFLPSLNGETLVPFATAKSDLLSLIRRDVAVSVHDIPRLLELKNPESLLDWADGQEDLSTPGNRRPSVPPWIQKTIAIHFFAKARHGFVSLQDVAHFWSLPLGTIEKIVAAYSPSFSRLEHVEGYHISLSALTRAKASLRRLCTEAQRTASSLNVSHERGDVPKEILATLLQQMAHGPDALEPFEIERRDSGLWFVPVEAMKRLEEEQRTTSFGKYAEKLSTDGYCIVSEDAQATHSIVEQLGAKAVAPGYDNSSQAIVQLEKHADTKATDWASGETAVLVKQQLLTSALGQLLSSVPAAATAVWHATQDEDGTFNASVCNHLSPATDPAEELNSLILLSTSSSSIRQAYQDQLLAIHAKATKQLWHHLQLTLSTPISLYTKSLDLCASDPTLKEHQQSFLLSHIVSDILPTSLPLRLALAPPAAAAKELSRFRAAAETSPSVDALTTALKRLMRKTRPAQDDWTLPTSNEVRDDLLAARVRGLDRVMRPSDVLQQVTWVLLASVVDEDVLFVSGGRDAGRMVKLLSRVAGERPADGGFDWVAAARRMETFRASVKEGKQTEQEVEDVRDLGRRGFDARVRRS